MRIIFLENDHLQAEQIEHDIRAGFAPAEVMIERIATEYLFRCSLDEIAQNQPDVAILDVMLHWTDPGPKMPKAPRDVEQGGHYRAGLRCARLLIEKAPRLPIILYTVLEESDLAQELRALAPNVRYVAKCADSRLLNETIRQVLHQVRSNQH